MKTTGQKAASGAIWSVIGLVSVQGTQLLTAAVLSRILSSEDFGLVAMVLVVSGLLTMFASAGIAPCIVQYRELGGNSTDTFITVALLAGSVCGATMSVSAPLVASFFSAVELTTITQIASLSLPFLSLSQVVIGLATRDFGFRNLNIWRLQSSVASGLIGISLALFGFGYWALVVQIITRPMFLTLSGYTHYKIFPKLSFCTATFSKVCGLASSYTSSQFINYWTRNLDNILIGRFLGEAALGFYTRAYALMSNFLSLLSGALNPVLHPTLSSKINDIDAMRRAYLRFVCLLALISFPLMLGVSVFSSELIYFVWGSNWNQSIPVFTWLAVASAWQPIQGTLSSVYLACDKSRLLFFVTLVSMIVICVGIVTGLGHGILGVAIGFSIGSAVLFFPLYFYTICGVLQGGLLEAIYAIAPGFECGLVVLAAGLLVKHTLQADVSSTITLLLGGIFCLMVYVMTLRIRHMSTLRKAKGLHPVIDRLICVVVK